MQEMQNPTALVEEEQDLPREYEGVYRTGSTWAYRIQWSKGGKRDGVSEGGFPSAELAADARDKRLGALRGPSPHMHTSGNLLWLHPSGLYSGGTASVVAHFCRCHGVQTTAECEKSEPLFRMTASAGGQDLFEAPVTEGIADNALLPPRTGPRLSRQEAAAQKLAELLARKPLPDRRVIARQVVELRRLFKWDGRPDWAGRSQDYRDTIYQAYKDAGVPSDAAGGFQANLRYHVGNVVRTVAPREDLLALGMDPEGPRGRAVRARRKAKAPRPLAEPRPSALVAMQDPLALAAFALDALQAARDLRPRGEMAAAVEPVLRSALEEAFSLLAECEVHPPGPAEKQVRSSGTGREAR